MADDDQPDLFESRKARDAALKDVADHSQPWMDRALAFLPLLRVEFSTVTGEQVRLWLEKRLEPPHHHNAYGALINTAIKRGILIPTGCLVPMAVKKSHARKTPVYRTLYG